MEPSIPLMVTSIFTLSPSASVKDTAYSGRSPMNCICMFTDCPAFKGVLNSTFPSLATTVACQRDDDAGTDVGAFGDESLGEVAIADGEVAVTEGDIEA